MREKIVKEALIPKTQIGVLLLREMNNRGLSIKDLADEFELSYEHIRKLVRGVGVVSRPQLKMIATHFGWDWAEAERLLVEDKFRIRNGKFGAIAQSIHPGAEPFNRGWNLLTDVQRKVLLDQLDVFVRQNQVTHPTLATDGAKAPSKAKAKVVRKSGVTQ